MAIINFISPGSYTQISFISVDKEAGAINFTVKVYDKKEGGLIYPPATFTIHKESSIHEYLEKNPPALPEVPEYPKICSDREALVPMWTDESTAAEVEEYNRLKFKYFEDHDKYKLDRENAIRAAKEKAAKENDYETFFSDAKLYGNNPTVCAYEYLKTRPGFEGVEND